VSGPVADADAAPREPVAPPSPPTFERHDSREVELGGMRVRRALPKRQRRTIGAWCFLDHMGPADVAMAIRPHPHTGLQTVTWLLEGEALHRDSLGTEQPIRPGQLNLMTAGRGVSHAEEGTGRADRVHGVQLWVALPDDTRHGEPGFEHHAELPVVELGPLTATVLLGSVAAATSPGRTDSPLVGADLALPAGDATLPLDPSFEHGLVVTEGVLGVDGEVVAPGALAYLGDGRDELRVEALDGPVRALLVGGAPFGPPPLMWWNFVARTWDEIDDARADWNAAGTDRFGDPGSPLDRIPAPPR
jgi:redox-sensitive bicupin YhaK (pirin superfamily)